MELVQNKLVWRPTAEECRKITSAYLSKHPECLRSEPEMPLGAFENAKRYIAKERCKNAAEAHCCANCKWFGTPDNCPKKIILSTGKCLNWRRRV